METAGFSGSVGTGIMWGSPKGYSAGTYGHRLGIGIKIQSLQQPGQRHAFAIMNSSSLSSAARQTTDQKVKNRYCVASSFLIPGVTNCISDTSAPFSSAVA